MAVLNYIIWYPSPTIFSIGGFPINWYSLFILLAFLGGVQLVRYVYRQEGRPPEDVEKFSVWVLCSALVGAHLVHIFFYDLDHYLRHPIEIFLPITLDPYFKFIGYSGLSYHGAILGALIGTYLYANYLIKARIVPPRLRFVKQRRKGQDFLWLSNALALAMMMGFLVRVGNFFNSEIYGIPTEGQHGVLFVRNAVERLPRNLNPIAQIKVTKRDASVIDRNYQPINIEITFKNADHEEEAIKSFLEKKIKTRLVLNESIKEHVYVPIEEPLSYTLSKKRNAHVAQIQAWGIPRHPVQLYESAAALIALLVHFYWWRRKHKTLPVGVLAGSAMVVCYSFRFFIEFFKAPFSLVLVGDSITLTMGHLLSLLTVLGGIVLGFYSYAVAKKATPQKHGYNL